jgi:hypothetical protein
MEVQGLWYLQPTIPTFFLTKREVHRRGFSLKKAFGVALQMGRDMENCRGSSALFDEFGMLS